MREGGARPPPLITFTLTSKVAVYAPAEWADTLTLFHLYQYMYSVGLPEPLAASLVRWPLHFVRDDRTALCTNQFSSLFIHYV